MLKVGGRSEGNECQGRGELVWGGAWSGGVRGIAHFIGVLDQLQRFRDKLGVRGGLAMHGSIKLPLLPEVFLTLLQRPTDEGRWRGRL